MTAGKLSSSNNGSRPSSAVYRDQTFRPKPTPSRNPTSKEWFKNASAQRVCTNAVLTEAIRAEYPELHLAVCNTYENNLAAYAQAGFAGLAQMYVEFCL